MTSTAGRVFSGLTRAAISRRLFIYDATSTVRLTSSRSLVLGSPGLAKTTDEDKELNSEPIKFSTSKGSHKTWKVERSLGGEFQRPWWKVVPISLFTISFLLWCALRGETEIDAKLDQHLYKNLPGLLSDEEEQDD